MPAVNRSSNTTWGTRGTTTKWIPHENWCIEIDGQRYYGAWAQGRRR